jgi:hypothetical protein
MELILSKKVFGENRKKFDQLINIVVYLHYSTT